jgi:glycosyltransferase involved in cell wall biosynthesis
MNSDATITVSGAGRLGPVQADARRLPRLALICDFLEERWPSMDLMGEMLYRSFRAEHPAAIEVEQLRPVLRCRLSKIPGLGRSGFSWNADRLLNRFHDYPVWLRERAAGFDVFHIVDHSYSQLVLDLPAERTVVTCHDLDTFRCVLEPERDPRPAWFRAMAGRTLNGFRRAAHVLTVSQATREELLRHGIFPAERITVVPNGVHPSCSITPDPVADRVADGLLAGSPGLEATAGTPWLLNVGSTLPRKRLDILVRAFAAIHREMPEARLVRVGGLTPAQLQLAAELKVKHLILCLPYLERDVLAAVYRRSALLMHTADAEGFGLPLVEAMACGCPVAASDLPVLREVGGAAAEYCRAGDVDDWEQAVVPLLREKVQNPAKWAGRRAAGMARAARFSWAENARQTAQVYEKVLGLQHDR